MDKAKQIWGYVVAGVGALIGILLFFLSRKGKEVDALNAKINLAKTEKQADVLETEIKVLKTNKDNLNKHNEELDKALETVENKRVEIREEAKNLKDPKAIADYWNNQ